MMICHPWSKFEITAAFPRRRMSAQQLSDHGDEMVGGWGVGECRRKYESGTSPEGWRRGYIIYGIAEGLRTHRIFIHRVCTLSCRDRFYYGLSRTETKCRRAKWPGVWLCVLRICTWPEYDIYMFVWLTVGTCSFVRPLDTAHCRSIESTFIKFPFKGSTQVGVSIGSSTNWSVVPQANTETELRPAAFGSHCVLYFIGYRRWSKFIYNRHRLTLYRPNFFSLFVHYKGN